jgi:archaetidylinositol phosphate synthase
MISKFKERLTAINPIAHALARLGIKPNTLSLMGFFSSILTAGAFWLGELVYALFFLLITSFLDLLDGAVARISKKTSKFGGFLDSNLDRYSDGFILIGIALFLDKYYVVVFLALIGSLLVSYSRARAELVIPKCEIGFAERAERLIVLIGATFISITGLFPPSYVLLGGLIIIAVITHITVIQRIWYTYRQLSSEI